MWESDEMKLISCNSNRPLADKIAGYLDIPLTNAEVKTFKDREVFVKVNENVRGKDVYIIQSTSAPANDHLMELLIMTDALVRASARRITAVVPYFGYARQDRKTDGRTPISAKLVANLITVAGINRVVTVDLHSAPIQGFFDCPTDNLFAQPEMVEDILKKYGAKDLMVISPDVGGVVRARALAKRLDTDLAIVDKRREKAGESEVMNIIGDVAGRKCILIDDMTDSGGTLINAADALLKNGAKEVAAYVTHGVLSNGAAENIDKSQLKELVITDTIQASELVKKSKKIRTISLAPLIGEAIRRIANDESISKMFD
jgi:ribose-phosphate pyrophosphokinase